MLASFFLQPLEVRGEDSASIKGRGRTKAELRLCRPACPTRQGEGSAQVGVDSCVEHIERDWMRELDTQV